jgi:hypothetical protein
VLEFLHNAGAIMTAHPRFEDVSHALEAGLENLRTRKWYCKIDDTDVYFICLGEFYLPPSNEIDRKFHLALDPKGKLAYARQKWDKDHFDTGVKRLDDWFELGDAKLTLPSVQFILHASLQD